MSSDSPHNDCPAEEMAAVVEVLRQDDERGLSNLDALIGRYPEDAKLHFLRGSVLAGMKRYDEARQAMQRSVDLAPLYAVARLQLGLLELSSGLAEVSDQTLQPLEQLGPQNPYALFARGLRLVMRDDFGGAVEALREGIARNTENPAINSDMQMLVDELRQTGGQPPTGGEPTTSTQLLLQQFAVKGAKH